MLFNRVLVTGANGLLGQALVQRLGQDREYDVLATARALTAQASFRFSSHSATSDIAAQFTTTLGAKSSKA